MVLYAGKVFTATRTGQRTQSVVCEKCGTGFHYDLARVGAGKGSAPYFIGQQGAADRAEKAAARDLEKRLDREAEMVPCPKCNWVNQELVDRYRRQLYRRAWILIAVLVAAGVIGGPVLWAILTETLGHRSSVPRLVSLAFVAISLSSPVWVLLLRRQLRLRIDPNATYPRRPQLPPGTPPALIERRDPQTGEAYLEPIASVDGSSSGKEWAVFRPGQLQFPPVCCMCLAEATTTFHSPMQTNENSEIEVPLCRACSGRLRVRWWLILLSATLISLGAGALLAMMPRKGDAFGRWMIFGLVGFFGSLLGGVIAANEFCRPYRIRVVDGERGIFKFAASNPAYTALLVEQIRAMDGAS